MTDQFFPLLKNTTRIKKMASFCWVVEIASDDGTSVTPLEAFILTLCCGNYDLETLKYIYASTFKIEPSKVSTLVDDTLHKLSRYIEWNTHASTKPQRYSPKQFLYNQTRSELTSQGRFETPGEATLILTHICNFRCIYCFNSSGKCANNEMSTNEWLGVIDQAKALQIVKCTLSGGEPMLHPGFFEILKKLVDSDILSYICTNGSLINKRIAHNFADMGIPCIQISLDAACSGTQDKITAVPETFAKVIGAIKSLVDTGIEVYIKAVLIPINVAEVGQLIDLCHDLGVKKLILDRFDLSNAGRGDTSLFISQEQEIDAVVERKQKKIGKNMSIAAVTGPRCWSRKDDIINCGALRTAVTILPSGVISLCEKLIDVPEMTAGNVREKPIEQIWISEKTQNIVTPPMHKIDEPCESCEHLSFCRTGCYAQTLFVSDNPYDADPRCWKSDYACNPYLSQLSGGLDE